MSTKPPSTREAELAAALTATGKTIAVALIDALTTCVHCVHFQEGPDVCQLYNARPPARVIAFGCESFLQDTDIPF